MSKKIKGSQAVIECLKEEECKYIFGVPGGQILSIMDSLFDTSEIRFVTTRDERGAACMADAYARFTGNIGVCIATTGPGVTNLLTGIGGALRDSSPVVVITGNNRAFNLNCDNNQEADHVSLLNSLTKWSYMVTRAAQIPWAMREAFRRAQSGTPGPVHLDFTRDILESEYVEYMMKSRSQYRTEVGITDESKKINSLTNLLLESESPTIWAGRGAIISKASSEILQLAETLSIPVITTYNGIGSVPTTHPLVFGSRFRHGSRLTKAIIEDTDLLLVVGNSLNAASTSRWQLKLPDNLVQIDIDPIMIGRHYPIKEGLVGDAKQTILRVLESIQKTNIKEEAKSIREKRIDKIKQWQKDWKKELFQHKDIEKLPIKPQLLVRTINETIPNNSLIVGGAGNPGIWTNLLEIREPYSYVKPVGFGNMAFALPAAIGAKIAYPEKPVICIIGDGALGMCISELETSVREETPVIVIVMNNFSYGNIKQEQLSHYGPRYIGVDFIDTDYSAIAKGFLADGSRIKTLEELREGIKNALNSEKTYLLDVLIDPDESVWTDPF
jgi:acetolactate synthase-1/2/3 large subunit